MKNIATLLIIVLLLAGSAFYLAHVYYPPQRVVSVSLQPTPSPVPGDASRIDQHALNAPAQVARSVDVLAAYLIQPAQNDRDKVRAIFRWITANIAYDVQGFLSGNYGDVSPEGVLQRRVAVCEGYARLFTRLAELSELQAITVGGSAKGYGVSGAAQFTTISHAWNAVKLDGRWQLLDATWGAGYVDDNGRFVQRLQEHYYLTPPEQFIYDHFPDDPQWLLLATPLSQPQFDALVRVRPAFFQSGLALKSHTQYKIQATDRVQVIVQTPPDILVTAHLRQGSAQLPATLTFCQKSVGAYTISAVFPQPGTYQLKMFAKRASEAGDEYPEALEYLVQAAQGAGAGAGFPETYGVFQETGSYLYAPLENTLRIGGTQAFKLRVPGAEEVAVIMGQQWQTLVRQGDLFEGSIAMQSTNAVVVARFPGDNQFKGLLQYGGR